MTKIPLGLMVSCEGDLVSRSQAKRLVNRFDNFSEVVLDFLGVPTIGQGFADEVFRVFVRNNPEIKIVPIKMAPAVALMIKRVVNSR